MDYMPTVESTSAFSAVRERRRQDVCFVSEPGVQPRHLVYDIWHYLHTAGLAVLSVKITVHKMKLRPYNHFPPLLPSSRPYSQNCPTEQGASLFL